MYLNNQYRYLIEASSITLIYNIMETKGSETKVATWLYFQPKLLYLSITYVAKPKGNIW